MKLPNNYKIKLITILILWIFLIGILTLSAPGDSNVALIMMPLLVLGAAVFGSIKFIMDSVSNRLGFNTMLSSSISGTVVLALMLSALGDVRAVDLLMLLSLSILAVFYFNRTWPK